jgi:hypothetical protein
MFSPNPRSCCVATYRLKGRQPRATSRSSYDESSEKIAIANEDRIGDLEGHN